MARWKGKSDCVLGGTLTCKGNFFWQEPKRRAIVRGLLVRWNEKRNRAGTPSKVAIRRVIL